MSLEKVKTLKEIGVTRVSLGVENFNDEILEVNGRAHLSPEIFRAYEWLQQVGFPQINVDLIAGMIGETDENWAQCIERVKQMEPDNITIYQMELPYNTLIAREMQGAGDHVAHCRLGHETPLGQRSDGFPLRGGLPHFERQRAGAEPRHRPLRLPGPSLPR